jgi:hypothetical protein
MDLPARHVIDLHSMDIRANRRRRYRIVLSYDPKSETAHSVTVFWGRSGCRTRRVVFRADDVEAALAYLRSVVRKRKRRDYRVSHVDDDHPLAEWLADIQIPAEELPDTQMDLFSNHTGAFHRSHTEQPTLFS